MSNIDDFLESPLSFMSLESPLTGPTKIICFAVLKPIYILILVLERQSHHYGWQMVRNIIISSQSLVTHRGHEANNKWCFAERLQTTQTNCIMESTSYWGAIYCTLSGSTMCLAYGAILQCKCKSNKSTGNIYPLYPGTRMCFGFIGEIWTT